MALKGGYPGGFLLVDKPRGLTSRKVVDKIRNMAEFRGKIGHSGTLDPMATGLLVLCLGKATRLASYLIRDDKSYLSEIELGEETDTGDMEGRVTFENREKVMELDEGTVSRALKGYRGVFNQVPPSFSARKVAGKRAYELARRGEKVELQASEVEIKEIEILEMGLPKVRFYIRCSSGTYIRSLALDVGRILGTGGHLVSLRRLTVGPFSLGEAEGLDKLEKECRYGNLAHWLFPPYTVLGGLSKVVVDDRAEELLRRGSPVDKVSFQLCGGNSSVPRSGREVQVWSRTDFLAVGRIEIEGKGGLLLYPEKVLG
jgi:tRNA pseudouridine55 synthase